MLDSVRLVEIEIHSYCNRKCNWCPNKFIDRKKYIELDEWIYISLLKELKSKEFSGVISFSRYNEPLLEPELLIKRTQQAKSILPKIKLVTNTNGDYLNNKNLDGLMIDELSIMDYDCIGESKCIKKLVELGATIKRVDYPFIYAFYKNINILYYIDWPKNTKFIDRGGMIPKYSKEKRGFSCIEPSFFVGVDYNGKIVPCCNIRSDFLKHKNYVLGDLRINSLESILNSDKAVKFREDTKNSIFTNKYPCKHCFKTSGRYTRGKPSIMY